MTEPLAAPELFKALVGLLFVAIGLVTTGLWSMVRQSRDRALLWFSVVAILYGLRLAGSSAPVQIVAGLSPRAWSYWFAGLSYVLLVPVGLLAGAHRGGGWRRTLWIYPSVAAAAAITGLAVDRMTATPGRATPLNQLLVLLGFVLMAAHVVPRWREAGRARLRPVLVAGAVFATLALYETFTDTALLSSADLEPLALLAFVVTIGHYSASRVFENEARLAAVASELAMATRIQQSILPQRAPDVRALSVAARYVPMSEVAGDFYEFVPLDASRFAVLVADVSGHGVPAALIASMVKIAVAAHAQHAHDPSRMLQAINQTFIGRFDSSFITAFYAVVDSAQRAVTYSSAGHPPALLVRRTGAIDLLSMGAMMLGFADVPYPEASVPFGPGDRLLIYTDGLTEACPASSEEFFGDRGLQQALVDGAPLPPQAFAELLLARAQQWAAGGGGALGDDLTFVVVDFDS